MGHPQRGMKPRGGGEMEHRLNIEILARYLTQYKTKCGDSTQMYL